MPKRDTFQLPSHVVPIQKASSSCVLAACVKSSDRERWLQVVREVAQLLDCLHSSGFVHRDVKPSNIVDVSEDATHRDWRLIDLASHACVGAHTVHLYGICRPQHVHLCEQVVVVTTTVLAEMLSSVQLSSILMDSVIRAPEG